MADESEEKTEEPTKRKLEDARKKGQIAQSKDVVTVTLTVAVAAYIWFSAGLISDQFGEFYDAVALLSQEPFEQTIWQALRASLTLGIQVVGPVIAIIVGVVIVTSIIVNKGLLFAPDQIAPKFDKINPAKRFKELFKAKNLLEAAKSAIKIVFIFVITWIVLRIFLYDLLLTPHCGENCMTDLIKWTFLPFLAAIALLFLIFAFFDHFLQQYLFRKEMRMTKTELKRHMKDQEGDPLIKGHRRNLARELLSTSPDDGVSQTTVVINDGMRLAVGLRYVPDEGGVPVVITIAVDQGAERFLEKTAEQNKPRIESAKMAQELADKSTVGEPVPRDMFDEVASAIAGLSALEGLR